MTEKPLLYIEDEETDVMLLQLAVQHAHLAIPVQTVGDGEEAMAYLSGTGRFSDREAYPIPSLVFLDLNLPLVPGMKVLKWIREQPDYADLPVVIYSSSGEPGDLEKARHFGANDYFIKPARIEQIAEIVKRATEKWLTQGSPCPGQ